MLDEIYSALVSNSYFDGVSGNGRIRPGSKILSKGLVQGYKSARVLYILTKKKKKKII